MNHPSPILAPEVKPEYGSINPAAPNITENLLPLLLDHANKMIFVKDAEFRIVFANKLFLQMYSPEKRPYIIGTTTVEDFTKEEVDVFLAEDRKALETGYSQLTEEIADYQGKKHHLHSQKIRFIDNVGNKYVLGICDDITKHALKEKELAEKNISLENFAAVAAHDLRSPLASCVSALNFIEHMNPDLPKQTADILSMIRQTCTGLTEQITGLLAIYKTSSTNTSSAETIDLKLVIEETKLALNDRIISNNATVLSNNLPEIIGDRHMFRQVFSNLIENSIKYRSAKKPIVIIRCEENNDEYLFTVEDNGIGIQLKDQGNVFSLYTQGDAPKDGVGIGMSLCKKIIEHHGGRIWVDSHYNIGCRICFIIPKQGNN